MSQDYFEFKPSLSELDCYDFIDANALPSDICGYRLEYLQVCSSTLDCYRLGQRKIYWADYQTHSRGQKGRVWKSVFGRQILLSIVIPNQLRYKGLLYLVYAILQALLPYEPHLRYKWPNDLYRGKDKIAGLLIENKNDWAVLSIGLNTTYQDLLCDIGALWPDQRHHVNRITLIRTMIQEIEKTHHTTIDPETMINFLKEHHLYALGEQLCFESHDGVVQEKRFLDLNIDGSIVLESLCEKKSFYSGRIIKDKINLKNIIRPLAHR